ncbi:MAG: MerR family transcriptional regulator [Solirubrobacterales bacterium]
MAVPVDTPLTLPQVAEAADVEYRTLHTWVKRGLLPPSFSASTGAGRPNLFSFQDTLKARILAHLRSAGIDLEMLERTAEGLKEVPELDIEDTILVNGHLTVLKGGDDLDAAIDEAQPSVVYRVVWASEALEQADLK